MPAPANVSELLALIEKSGVADAQTVRQALAADGVNGADPRTCTDRLIARNLITNFQADQLLAGRHRGFRLGQYRILSVLGSGGMGKVYLAEHVFMKRRVALKILPKNQAEDSSAIERFQREAMAVAALNHKNIVQAYDSGMEGEVYYLAMEYVAGMSLQEYVKKFGPVPWPHAAEFVRQAAVGLHHALQAGLIHRDIKPGNLLVDGTGVIKLLDLGLAMFFGGKHDGDPLTLKYNENVLGTADYLSPEQAVDSHNVDSRADIYSLGCTFYYLLTGRAPFPGGSIAQKLLAHQQKDPPPIGEFVVGVPEAVLAVFRKMTAKSPDQRFANPAELVGALKGLTKPLAAPFDVTPKPLASGNSGQESSAPTLPPGQETATDAPAEPEDTSFDFIRAANESFVGAKQPALAQSQSRRKPIAGAPANSDSQNKPKPANPPKATGETAWVWISVGVGAVALIVAAVFVAMNRQRETPRQDPITIVRKEPPKKTPPKKTPDADPNEVLVKSGLGWAGPTSLRDGVAAARERQRVLLSAKVSGDWYATEVALGPDGFPNLHYLEIAGEKPTVAVVAPTEAKPILRVAQTRGVVVRNLTLDGNGQPGPLILVEGDGVEGFRLENVTLRNYTGDGVVFAAARGTKDAPLKFDNVTFAPVADQGVGLKILPSARDPSATRFVELAGCRFLHCKTGVEIAGPATTVAVATSSFLNGGGGIRYAPGAGGTLFQSMVVDGCTFRNLPTGLAFADKLLDGAKVEVRNCLFAGIRNFPLAATGAPDPAADGRIVVDRSATDAGPTPLDGFHALTAPTKIDPVAFESEDPASADFLVPKPNPKHREIAKDRGYLGARPPKSAN